MEGINIVSCSAVGNSSSTALCACACACVCVCVEKERGERLQATLHGHSMGGGGTYVVKKYRTSLPVSSIFLKV